MTGLRERKKAKTRSEIRAHALRLFREQGFAATTVDQIAAAAEVSQSTFFRYFPTKEDVVLQDDTDPLMIEAFRSQPPELSPIAALRESIRSVYAEVSAEDRAIERERQALIVSVPELRARMLDEFMQVVGVVAAVVAERTGRAPDDIAVTTLAGAVIGVVLAGMAAARSDPSADLMELMDAGLAQLETGFAF
jgi:AcrR family transcriptional regulator